MREEEAERIDTERQRREHEDARKNEQAEATAWREAQKELMTERRVQIRQADAEEKLRKAAELVRKRVMAVEAKETTERQQRAK